MTLKVDILAIGIHPDDVELSASGTLLRHAAQGRTFGLRAADDGMDVSEVAKQYGGGGHAKAAGFKVPRDHALAIA